MGTRSLTFIFDVGNTHLVTIYKQFDGYPEGLGAALAEMANRKIVNGIGEEYTYKTHANGFCELGAMIIAEMKREDKAGNVYLSPEKDLDGDLGWAEFAYIIQPDGELQEGWDAPQPQVKFSCHCVSGNKLGRELFSGRPVEFAAWLEKRKEQDND